MLPSKTRPIRRDKTLFRAAATHHVKPSFDPAICSRCHSVWRIRFSQEDKLVRVYWRRDAAGSPP